MHEAADQLGLPRSAVSSGLGHDVVQANEDFAMDAGGRGRRVSPGGIVAIIEGDDIGGSRVFEELPVQAGHFRRGDKVHPQRPIIRRAQFSQQSAGDAAELSEIDRAGALAIAQDQLIHYVCRDAPRRR